MITARGKTMMRLSGWRTNFTSLYFLIIALVIALLLGGGAIALLLGGWFGHSGIYAVGCVIGALLMVILFILRKVEIAAAIIIGVCLVVDWYLGIHLLGVGVTLVLLVALFLNRSPRYPWTEPRAMWLWVLFLLLTILPTVQGGSNYYDATFVLPQ